MRDANQHPEWRRNMYPDTPVSRPTLAHVPGIDPSNRYRTKLMQMVADGRGMTLQKPRTLHSESAAFTGRQGIIHLGKGRTING